MVLSEGNLKVKYRRNPFSTLEIEKGTLLTPSAKQFILDKRIELIEVDKREIKTKDEESESASKNIENEKKLIEGKYVGINGEIYLEKPVYMTQIEGNLLVLKTNKRIVFRGKLELFLSELLLFGKTLELSNKNLKLLEEIKKIIKFTNNILIAESLDKTLEDQLLLDGYSIDKIQDIARNPKENLGRGHIIEINFECDILVHTLNRLRALAREVEICAIDYFFQGNRISRTDLLKALNVLSSILYILILKYDNGEYSKE